MSQSNTMPTPHPVWPYTLSKSPAHPPVSILTPTYNRRPFIKQLISYILTQTYPIARMEWVVLDDGTDTIEDLLEPLKVAGKLEIQYIRSEEKLSIGAKRNRLHAAARGDIFVAMDDDDFYPPERVSHAVTTLRSSRTRICGASRNHLYFVDDGSIWAVGPYSQNHATFGTMAYTRQYAQSHLCNEDRIYAEEVEFTRTYSEPLAQLDPMKVMLVLCHPHNTFDKRQLRTTENPMIRKTALKLRNFIGNAEHRRFYTTLSEEACHS